MELLADTVFMVFMWAIAIFFPIAFILIFLKRRRAKLRQSQQKDGPLNETRADLETAEEQLRQMPIDIRETLIETHDLYERFTTHRGYSRSYMDKLVQRIRASEIECEIYFQPTLPMGVADAIVEPQGIYELYIVRGKVLAAKKVVPALLETNHQD